MHRYASPGTRIKFEKRHIYMIEGYLGRGEAPKKLPLVDHSRVTDHFREAVKEKMGPEKYKKWLEIVPDGYCPAKPDDVAAWFREEAKKDPSLLDGSGGLDAEDLGVALMMPLAQCMGKKDIFYNIGNMILLPRAEAALMTEYE